VDLLRREEDGVMAFLADEGDAMTDCFTWSIMRRFLLSSDKSLTVAELLGPYFARHETLVKIRGDDVDSRLLPPRMPPVESEVVTRHAV
jgi:hypothetical protein